MAFRCVRSCLQSDLGGHDPLQEALAKIERLRAALTQITTVCNDNAQVSDQGKGMALDFVHQIAGAALSSEEQTKC